MAEDEDIILSELPDDELVEQMHDDLYDGLADEVVEGTQILLDRGWTPYDTLTKALVEGMRIVGIDFRDGILWRRRSHRLSSPHRDHDGRRRKITRSAYRYHQ